jgi:very-short-patch-repair endonuclease
VRDRNGVVFAHVDLGYREQRVGMEYEGRGHAEGAQFDRDLDRYTELSALGWLILRASRRDLSGQSRVFVEQVRAALRRRGLAV